MSLIACIMRIAKGKKAKKMKNGPKRGKSARNGNAPSPYTKYNKKRYVYSWEHRGSTNIEKEKQAYQTHKKAA